MGGGRGSRTLPALRGGRGGLAMGPGSFPLPAPPQNWSSAPAPRAGASPQAPCRGSAPGPRAGASPQAPVRGLRPRPPCGGFAPGPRAGASPQAPVRGLRPRPPCGGFAPGPRAGASPQAPVRGLRPRPPCGGFAPGPRAGTPPQTPVPGLRPRPRPGLRPRPRSDDSEVRGRPPAQPLRRRAGRDQLGRAGAQRAEPPMRRSRILSGVGKGRGGESPRRPCRAVSAHRCVSVPNAPRLSG